MPQKALLWVAAHRANSPARDYMDIRWQGKLLLQRGQQLAEQKIQRAGTAAAKTLPAPDRGRRPGGKCVIPDLNRNRGQQKRAAAGGRKGGKLRFHALHVVVIYQLYQKELCPGSAVNMAIPALNLNGLHQESSPFLGFAFYDYTMCRAGKPNPPA